MIARGRVTGARGGLFEVEVPGLRIGSGVRIETPRSSITGTVRAIDGRRAYVAIHAGADGIAGGIPVRSDDTIDVLPLGTCALGRAFDATGVPLDDGPPLRGVRVRFPQPAMLPDERRAIAQPLWTGVKAIDAMLTIGRGARVGLFGSRGAGKRCGRERYRS